MSRSRLVGSALSVGFVVGTGGFFLATVALGTLRAASDTVFLLGALAFGFGLLGWSGSILAANSVRAMQEQLDVASDWTESDSRRAMARIGGFGFGVMVGAVVGTVALGGV